MIDGVGKAGRGSLETARAAVDGNSPVAPAQDAAGRGKAATVESSVFELVSSGPPVDSAKVTEIRAAIAEGRYPVNPEKIAERMIALDLGHRLG